MGGVRAGHGAHLLARPVDPVLPDVFGPLWAERGPAIKAAQLAVVEAEADVADLLGLPT